MKMHKIKSTWKSTANAVIIGAGINGMATAYNLAKLGVKDVVVIEKNTVCSGSTARCGAGIRAQWGTKMNCQLGLACLDIFEQLSDELGMDIGLNQCGYLMVAYKDSEFATLQESMKLQNSLGLKTRVVSYAEAKQICPGIAADDAVGFTFHDRDGHADPFLTTFAYQEAAKRLGVTVHKFTEVTSIKVSGDKITGVTTTRGDIDTPIVINCAGPYSQQVAAMAGIKLPNYSERHEILITEPVEFGVCPPMLMSFTGNYYIQQRPNGTIIGGCSPDGHPEDYENLTTAQFAKQMSTTITKLLPSTKGIRMVRQWSGMYNMTPDKQPELGHTEVDGFYLSVGYSGHGFMFGTITGKLIAEMIVKGESSIDVSMLDYRRFEKGELIIEPAVV